MNLVHALDRPNVRNLMRMKVGAWIFVIFVSIALPLGGACLVTWGVDVQIPHLSARDLLTGFLVALAASLTGLGIFLREAEKNTEWKLTQVSQEHSAWTQQYVQ